MGGFVAGPGGLMAKLLGIPLIIHEQNRVPGTTNRLLARLANQVLEGFPGSFKTKVAAKSTGNPLRKAFLSSLDHQVEKSGNAVKLLVVGGSQGAKILNETLPDALVQLKNLMGNDQQILVKHQTGLAMHDQVLECYQELLITADVQAFIKDMVRAYQWADLVICRAGAMTVSEIAAMGVPAIFIPLPNAIDDHQTANAHYLSDAGAGIILAQKDMTPISLATCINKALTELPKMSVEVKKRAFLDATEVVASYCIAEAAQ
jgi:UDP-N-acetylglucosamine--N-acetylmuramyl-(pentapeptide) pyrophosphoryl-undecaprenol N-acetylglucosamine transferase